MPWWRHQMETFSVLLALCEGNHRLPVDFPHKCQWRGALMLSLICAWTNGWANNRDARDLSCHCAHYDVTVMMPTARPCWMGNVGRQLLLVSLSWHIFILLSLFIWRVSTHKWNVPANNSRNAEMGDMNSWNDYCYGHETINASVDDLHLRHQPAWPWRDHIQDTYRGDFDRGSLWLWWFEL